MGKLLKICALAFMMSSSIVAHEVDQANEIAKVILCHAPTEVQSYFGDYTYASSASLIGENYTEGVRKSLQCQLDYLREQRSLHQDNPSLVFEIDILENILRANQDILTQKEIYGVVDLINPWYQVTYGNFMDPLEYVFNGLSDFILRGGQDKLAFARKRFQEYVQGDGQKPPLVEGIMNELRRLKRKYENEGKKPILPCQQKLKRGCPR